MTLEVRRGSDRFFAEIWTVTVGESVCESISKLVGKSISESVSGSVGESVGESVDSVSAKNSRTMSMRPVDETIKKEKKTS